MSSTPQIPLVKVGLPSPERLMPALQEVLYSGFIAEGQPVYEFERALCSRFELPRALCMSSGTAALHAALVLSGVERGDEVISTAMTAEPTNVAILHAGAKPVFADVDPLSGNLDPDSIRSAISERTRAIVVVHYAGFPVRLREVLDIAAEHRLPVIEDCAHALGARYEGRSIGTLAAFGLYSFQAIKHMTTVDGGALTFSDPERAAQARRFRWFGLEKGVPRTEVDIQAIGYKYNMNNVTATIGLLQLEAISSRLAQHIDNGHFFDREIPQIPGLAVTAFDRAAEPSYWLYTVLSDDSADVERRLASIGVAASKLHRPNHLHTIFSDSALDLPGLDDYYRRMIHIPCGWWVSHEDRERIVDALRKG